MIEKLSVDFKYLNDIRSLQREGSPDVLHKVISAYLKQTAESLTILRSEVGVENYEKIINYAHKMKSSSAMIGAMKFSSLSRELEMAGRQHAPLIHSLLPQLESEYAQVEQILNNELKKMDRDR